MMTLPKEKWRQQISDYEILFIKVGWLVDKSNRPLPFVNEEDRGRRGGNPPLSLTTKVKYTPWQIELNYAMFMLNSNKPIKVAHLQKLANESVLNGALVIEMVNNSFIES